MLRPHRHSVYRVSAKRHHGRGERLERRRAAWRLGRSVEPRSHRACANGRHRCAGPVRDRRPPSRSLQSDVHHPGLQHLRAGRDRPAVQLHGDGQRGSARRRRRGIGDRVGAVAGRRRAERATDDDPQPAIARRGAGAAHVSGGWLDRGLRTPDAVDLIYDANASVGGPIKRDKLWFFGSYRNVGNNNIVANSTYPDGSPGIYDQRVKNYTLRLTWQISPRNKLTVYDDYQTKYVGHLFTSGADVQFAAARRPPVLKYTDAVKWTSTVSNKLVFDAGFGTSVNAYRERYQPGVHKEPFTPRQ